MSTKDKEVNAFYICQEGECKAAFLRWGNLNLHVKMAHPGVVTPQPEKCKVDELPEGYTLRTGRKSQEISPAASPAAPPGAPSGAPPAAPSGAPPAAPTEETAAASGTADKENMTESKSVYKEAEEPSNILKRILESYPGLDKAVTAEIMSYTELKGTLHPMEVKQLLAAMAGVPKGAPEIIPQKYSLALQKAAEEGKQEVQLALSAWGMGMPYTPQSSGGLNLTPLGGMFGGLGSVGARLNPNFNPYLGGGYPGHNVQPWWLGPAGPGAEPAKESPAEAALKAEIEVMKEGQSAITKTIENLIGRITETEEQKKEAALNARFEKIENSIAELINVLTNQPKTDDVKDKAYEEMSEQLKETRGEIAKMREEAAQAQIKNLESQLNELKALVKNHDDERIMKLETDLAEAKEAAKKPVTGRTDLDVVADIANRAIDTVKDAGHNVNAWLMSGQNREKFNPERGDVAARKEAGEKLADSVEQAAALTAAEESYLKD